MGNKNLPEYIIADPTGNITVLVTEPVDRKMRQEVAASILKKEPSAEQLGFLMSSEIADIELEMAGGEFCGNASMSAAAYHAMKNGIDRGSVLVKVSGADEPVKVDVSKNEDGSFNGTVCMPGQFFVEKFTFNDGCSFPVVRFPGIDHIIIAAEENSKYDRKDLETRIKNYSAQLGSLCIGIMLFDPKQNSLTPLVYVPGADTLFWEHSCASGSSAVGAWLSDERKSPVNTELHEPGGDLLVSADLYGKIYLSGKVRLILTRKNLY